VTSPKLRDSRARRAVGLTIPRGQLRSEVEQCSVQLALGPLPPGHEALRGVEPPRFDLAEAARLLDEAGIVVPFKLTLIYPASSRQQERAATVIADELRRIGILLELEPLEWAQFMRRLETHDFEVAAIQWSIDAEPDLYPLFHSTQVAGALNYGGYSDPAVDAWLEALRGEEQRGRRDALLHELILRLRQDEPYSFLFSPLVVGIVRRGAIGVTPTPLGWEPRGWGWPPLDK
jgi:peptide/nickel transport system substrate-binding protein